jgi:hypothetical protein
MIQTAAIAALAAVIGGVVAVSVRDSRLVALGLLLALVASPLASSPEPSALAICFRAVGALLATYLLWASARSQSIASEGSGIGAVAEIAAVGAAFAVGWFAVPVKPLAGPAAAQAAGVALVALAVVPLTGRNVLQVGTGATLLVVGISLLLQAWAGPPTSAQQIALTVLLVGLVGATSLLIAPAQQLSIAVESAAKATAATAATAVEAPEVVEAEPSPVDLPAVVVATPVRTIGIRASTKRTRRTSIPAPAGSVDQADTPVAAADVAPAAPDEPAAPVPAPEVPAAPRQRFAPGSPRERRLHPRDPRR